MGEKQMVLEGASLSENAFTLLESFGVFEQEKFLAVMEGRVPLYIVKRIIPTHLREQIVKNFLSIVTLQGDRKDNVPTLQVGANSYKYTPKEYVTFVQETNGKLAQVLEGLDEKDIEQVLMENAIATILEQSGTEMRLAQFEGGQAGRFVARSWQDKGEYALEAHEDYSQQQQPKKKGFEIQDIKQVVSVSTCISQGQGGELVIWNMQPNTASKKELGLEETGYPYPLKLLKGIEKIVVPIEAGDVYFINGHCVHAVMQVISGMRLTLGYFLGFKNEKEVLQWT